MCETGGGDDDRIDLGVVYDAGYVVDINLCAAREFCALLRAFLKNVAYRNNLAALYLAGQALDVLAANCATAD